MSCVKSVMQLACLYLRLIGSLLYVEFEQAGIKNAQNYTVATCPHLNMRGMFMGMITVSVERAECQAKTTRPSESTTHEYEDA